MKKIFILSVIAIISFIIFSTETGKTGVRFQTETKADILIKTDNEFSDKSIKDGIAEAFLAYADDEVVLMRDKQFPIKGIEKLKEHYSKMKQGTGKLEWSPVKAEISASGELGYTFGNWIYTAKDETGKEDKAYGNYVTIWKKQKNGGWKFVLDGGNTTPTPEDNSEK